MKNFGRKTLQFFGIIICSMGTIQAQNIYPGDANADNVVNHIDLLYVGKNFGFTGNPRTDTANTFAPQTAPTPWGFSYYGVEVMYADCNGDGVIDANDTLAIHLTTINLMVLCPVRTTMI